VFQAQTSISQEKLVGQMIPYLSPAGYPSGFGTSLGFTGFGCVVVPIVYWWMIKRENKKREAIPVQDIRRDYTDEELHELGDLSPLYRYER
jgi:hypothetical protein